MLSIPILLSACTGGNNNKVVAIEKTGTYHREICSPVNMAKTKLMTVAEAKADHLRPCTVCKPDSL
jgi:methylphosphotriester-DNA--protein-cysteine methyltransferase